MRGSRLQTLVAPRSSGPWTILPALAALALAASLALAQETPEAPAREAPEVIQLPPMIVEGDDRWRLPDSVRDALWAEQQRDIEILLRERARQARRGAMIEAGKSGRLRFEFLPIYDPEQARALEINPGNERTEVLEIFRFGF